MTRRQAITGVAIANGLGARSEAVFARAFAGEDGFRPASDFFAFPFETQLGIVEAPDERGGDFPACAGTRLARVAFASSRQLRPAAAEAARRWGAERVACVFASSTGGLEQSERALAPHPSLVAASYGGFTYADHSADAACAALADDLGARGPRVTVSTACSSGLRALASAVRFIEQGLVDAAVVGSADSLCRTTVFGFHSLGLLAPVATRPFAQDRCGITLAEGSAYVVIERADDDSAGRALGWLAGVGASSDAHHATSPHPDGAGAERAMRDATGRAGIDGAALDAVFAHATGTRQNDATEGAALLRVCGPSVPVTATKSLTGHTLGSSGLTGLVLAVEALRRQEIPPSLRASPVDPDLGLKVVEAPTAARLENILVNAFGFGGSNASAVVSIHHGGA
ncbi:MAG TPA: beta-ketoacyl synthase N-terminal-like domain-containing protein [Kofleriaceae bacterium]|nr:beta-ketoacyl synthase N-terminal-like domain-containing protein [Kofleriaceae bacterium]